MQQLAETCGDEREASVSREISKLYDTTHRGTLKELIEYFTANNPRGEIVIVVSGYNGKPEKKQHRNKYKND